MADPRPRRLPWPTANRRTAGSCNRHRAGCRRAPRPGRRRSSSTVPGLGEVLRRVLGIDANFDRMTFDRCHPGLTGAAPGGDAQLLGHEIDTGDPLGDRMLDLDAGVHLHEEEVAGVVVDKELDRARAAVVDRLAPDSTAAVAEPLRVPPGRFPARAPPRRPSAGGAAANTPARTDGRRCGRRRAPAPRHAGRARRTARGTGGDRRTPNRLRPTPAGTPSAAPPRRRPPGCPDRRRPRPP